MDADFFRGALVRLATIESQDFALAFSRWSCDSEYGRLLDMDPSIPMSVKSIKEWIEKEREKDPPESFNFTIHTLAEDRFIGEVGLEGIERSHGDAMVGIGVGERDFWGKGYGTDAMRLILRFGFAELGLERVSLDVFEYNPRAIRSYEKSGFKPEGRMRQAILRDGRRYDLLFMGILREEWLETQQIGTGKDQGDD